MLFRQAWFLIFMMNKLIITGHSQGLGKALAEYYLQENWQVLGISRTLWPQTPENLQQCALDLADNQRLRQAFAGGLLADFLHDATQWLLINNAAQVAPNALAGIAGLEPVVSSVSLNILAPLLLSEEVIRTAPAGSQGGIVHISSGAGRKAYPGWSVYGAGKAALDHHALCLAAEQHPQLKVASIAPGVVDTAMQAEIRSSSEQNFPLLPRFLALKREGGLISAQQAAVAIARFLASPSFGREVVADIRDWMPV